MGAVNWLQEHRLVVHGEGDPPTRTERPLVLHPLNGADGAKGLAAEVGRAFVFYQDGCRAAGDGRFSYQR